MKPRCPAPPRSRCGSTAGHEQLRDCLHLTTMTTSCKHKKASLCIRVLSSAMPRCGPPVCAEVHVVYEAGGRSPPTCHATRAGPSSTRRRGKGGRRWPRHAARVGDRVVWWVITNQCVLCSLSSPSAQAPGRLPAAHSIFNSCWWHKRLFTLIQLCTSFAICGGVHDYITFLHCMHVRRPPTATRLARAGCPGPRQRPRFPPQRRPSDC